MEKRTGELIFKDGKFLEKVKIGNSFSYWDEHLMDVTDEVRKVIFGEKPVDKACPYLPSIDYNFQKDENLYYIGLSGLSREQMETIRQIVIGWREEIVNKVTV